jgi:hypothetical protein
MSEGTPHLLNVTDHEVDVVRLFAIDANLVPEFQRWWPSDERSSFVAGQLGIDWITPGFEDLVQISDLGEQGLEDYLTEGQGIEAAALQPDLEWIAAQKGFVLVISSAAFGEGNVELSPRTGLAALGAWHREAGAPAMLETPAAEEPIELQPRPMPPLRSGSSEKLALVVILLVALGLVALRFLL